MSGFVQVPVDGAGKRVDTVTLTDAAVEVHRQKMVVTGGSGTAEVVVVTNAQPAGTEMGLVVRQAGTAIQQLIAGAANIGFIDSISRTVQVQLTTPFTVNNISATVQVQIQTPFDLNSISRTVQVQIQTPFILQGISTTVSVQGNINISATATVVGTLGLAGQVSVGGSINLYTGGSTPSASRGPQCVLASTSANVVLIAAPGAGMAIFVTQLAVTNASGTNTRARVGCSASIGQVTMMLAASGGGFVMPFNPTWKLSANERLLCSVKPNASEGIFNVHFYVASADST